MVGDNKSISIPDLSGYRTSIFRLRGLRLIHTHLRGEEIDEEDLTDLAMLRLDMMVALTINEFGLPALIQFAHLLPENPMKKTWEIFPPISIGDLKLNFLNWVYSLEDQFNKGQNSIPIKGSKEKAILISVSSEDREYLERSLNELKELAESNGLFVMDSIIQRVKRISNNTLLSEAKLKELLIKCMQLGVDLIIFDQNLTPAQIASITDKTELRVLDRTQLILDIFAQRAHTQEGKIQVELAQLKYLFPKLKKKTQAFSRLTGGIGGRGPGETKLEIDRRRIKDRIHLLEKELIKLSNRREQMRIRRKKMRLPIISIIGYTNAGKSTLFNLLTKSHFLVEDRLFSTLDPTTRRIKIPCTLSKSNKFNEVLITDTVGLLKDLPRDLIGAFRPTLEELKESNLLIHLIDISNPCFPEHIESVEKLISDLNLDHVPVLRVFNKEDKIGRQEAEAICQKYNGNSISALKGEGLDKLLNAIEERLREIKVFKNIESDQLTNEGSFDIQNEDNLFLN